LVAATDLKIYKTTNGLGGAITGTQVAVGTPNNVFSNVINSQRVAGEDYYRCIFLKNTHATEKMDNFKLWLSDKSFPHDTEIKWGFEPNVAVTSGYRWSPYRTFNGSGGGVLTIADDPTLDLVKFTIATWFRTSDVNAPPEGEGFMICKGGWLSNDPDKNLNYGLWHSDANHLRGGFEESSGTDHIITTDFEINDGLWHHGVVTYDQVNVKLYYDGELFDTLATTTTPATSSNDLMIGDNSFNPPHLYYAGALDEIRIWDRAISASDVTSLFTNNTTNPSGLVYSNSFGTNDDVVVAQTIADQYTAPLNVTWNTVGTEPVTPNIGEFKAGAIIPIWLWYHVNPDALTRLDDNETFTFNFDIPLGGTGTGGTDGTGGSTGGNSGGDTPDYKIAIAGDWGCETATNNVIKLIIDNGYDFVVGVGDNAYESSSCWISKFNPLKPIMINAYGNHEYSESGGVGPYKTFGGVSNTYFTKRFENILFIVYDDNDFEDSSAPSLSVGSTQHNFIKNALEASQSDNTIVWRIAIAHHPWFGTGASHTTNEGGQVGELHKLFTDNKVSFICNGHNHNWERSHMVSYNSSDPRQPTVVDGTAPYVKNDQGLINVVTGGGGHDSGGGLYNNTSGGAWRAYANRTHNGIWEIVATNGGNTLTCSFVEIGGDKFDTFVITAT